MAKAQVGIVMGSPSDVEVMKLVKDTLLELGIVSEFRILSAHRNPKEVFEWAQSAEGRGLKVLVAAAGMAAHLAGVVAANTRLPVLGVPLAGGVMDGLDSLLSTLQMPKGTPVATFAVGKAGAINAALFSAKILAQSDSNIWGKLDAYKEKRLVELREADKKYSGS